MSTEVAALKSLAESMTGSVVMPDDAEFPSLRKTFLVKVEELLPQAVARCASIEDVAKSVAFAHRHGMPFALRSGGHSFADFCTTDGLLIDLKGLSSIEVDGDTVTVGPGVRLGPLSNALADHGRILPVGWNPLVGVGGIVLGGGYGMLSRYHGLGSDHLLAAQVVLADGTVVWADEEREADLFWALRGAGWGSFGVVTSMRLRTFPAPRVATFAHRWPWQRVAEVVDAWQRWAPQAPPKVNAELVLQSIGGPEDPRVTVFGAVVGNAADARPHLEEFIRRVDPDGELEELTELSARAGATRHTYAGMPVMDRQQPGPPMTMKPWLRAVKSEFFDEPMPADAIQSLLDTYRADHPPGQYRELEFIPWGGAFRNVAADATAFVHRSPLFQIGHHGIAMAAASDEERTAARDWVRRSFDAVHPAASGKVYPNYADPDLVDWADAYYGENLPRLKQVKARYDPEDVFRFAQSVPLPEGGGASAR
jgi:FAD/FMN-containing dehydrogenase